MPPRKDQASTDESLQALCDKFDQFLLHNSDTTNRSDARATAQFEALQATMQQHLDTTNKLLAALTKEKEGHQSPFTFPSSSDTNTVTSHPRHPKIVLPLFDGSNPLDWLFQADNYFSLYNTPENQRISLAGFSFTGEALSWYKYLHNNRLLGTWPDFSRDLELRFGPSSYENHQAALFKLRQTTTVAAYQAEFEKLCNHVVGLSSVALLNCYLSGLKEEIQAELAILKPTTLHQAYGLSKLVEDKLSLAKTKTYQPKSYSSPSTVNVSSSTTSNTIPPKSDKPPLLPNPPTPKTPLPFTKLSPEALQKRRSEGLCFRCPEKYFPGHKCNPPQFLLIADNEPDNTEPTTDSTLFALTDNTFNTTQSNQFFSLSTAAFFGISSPQALRVTGYIHNQPVQVLIDSGSTHNIIQPRVVSLLKLQQQQVQSFSVMVGNGDHLYCEGVCPALNIALQETTFTVPVFILPVEGADVILGLAWLRTLGPVLADFSIPQLTFNVGPKATTLRGETHTNQVSPSTLQTLIHKNSIASLHALYFHFEASTKPITPSTISHQDHKIHQLLQTYHHIFQTPTQLPPNRTQDHHIPTLPMSQPVNVKPYRYPHYQKQIMTTLISEMLRDGVIKPSQSPYSSPVLLVRKKDGSWRFCVDYRALNAITIKDRFPIPTVDELLDELHGATMFSKIDLTAGYHQIRVASEDTHKTAFRTIDGHYEFLVMPFGLTNAPSTFQATMNDLFCDALRQYVLVFFDDILIYSKNTEEHHHHLLKVFETLSQNKLFAKPSKCTFAVPSIGYLGHIISSRG
ncbi:uncharacterized protein LOC143559194 [Bidens hawaiensis]|uniref:uncharacterized protein LOC143559194 n=1 Tax=Bidens hawaiensis TaxID=980011 RepID=UPI00404B133E